jgi:hypothetical protein
MSFISLDASQESLPNFMLMVVPLALMTAFFLKTNKCWLEARSTAQGGDAGWEMVHWATAELRL